MSAPPRPPQVTVAGWVIMGGSLAVVIGAFGRVSKLHSLDLRTQVQHEVSSGWARSAGITADQVLSTMHVLALVAAACATAAAILGWYVLQASHSARLAVSILALPILIAGMDSSSLFAFLVAVAAATLWTPSARAWFRGEAAPAGAGPSSEPRPGLPTAPPTAPPSGPPAPTLPESGVPLPPAPPPAPSTLSPSTRPGGVLAAALLTWIFSGLTMVGLAAGLAYTVAHPHDLWSRALDREPSLTDQGLTQHDLVVAMCVLLGALGLLCVAASVVAVFVVRRASWARVTLIVLTAIAAAFLLIGAIGTGVAVVPLGAAGLTIALLARHDTVRWFDR